MNDATTLKRLESELARQDIALLEAERLLSDMGNVELRVSATWLADFEEACAPRAVLPLPFHVSAGVIRA